MSSIFGEQACSSMDKASSTTNTHTNSNPKPKMRILEKAEKEAIVTKAEEEATEVKADLQYVTLIVGDTKEAITLHKDVLCASSSFFKAACSPQWMQADNPVIELPEDDSEVIQTMVYWIYTGTICISKEALTRQWSHEDADDRRALKTALGLIIQLYVVGEKYDMPSLQPVAINAISACEWYTQRALNNAENARWRENNWPKEQLAKAYADNAHKHIHLMLIPYVYQNTFSTEASLRKLMVIMTLNNCGEEELAALKEKIPACGEFFYTLSSFLFSRIELGEFKNQLNLWNWSGCDESSPSLLPGYDEEDPINKPFSVFSAAEIPSPFAEYEGKHMPKKEGKE